MVAPTLLDCYAVRDLARFRKVLKGSPGDGDRQSGGNGTSSSYSKSPGHSFSHSLPGPCPPSEVNARDPFGRTALHLICSSTEPSAIDYLHALLSHPSVNINLGDLESGWTALHRALYNGNLLIALTLLRRNDVDIRAKDFEGLTPFDLFNGTIHGSNPLIKGERPNDKLISNRSYLNSGGSSRAASRIGDILDKSRSSRTDDDEEAEEEIETSNLDEESDAGKASSDLFTWGTNRNFTLGLGDGENRNLPDRVTLKKELPSTISLPPGAKYERLRVLEVKMSKMHTVALTSERSSNVWVCGIGANGRLGRSNGTQTAFEPLKDFKERATSVALGVDHTLLTTSNGGIYSFGLNKFNVLGYNLEQGLGTVGSSALNNSSKGGGALSATFGQQPHHSSGGGKQELDIQISPRRLAGPLKKEKVLGVAASKLHSACFTSEGSLFTWGTNTGQLGYDRSATPIQIQPRKVTATALSNPSTTSSSSSSSSASNSSSIQQITATEFATAILLSSWDVIVLHNDGAHRVHFPMNRFGPEISVFRPRQAQPKSTICRLTSSGTTFAALSDMGDLFTFGLNHPSDYANSSAPASQSSLLNSTTANLGGGGGGAFAALSSSVHHQEPKSSSRPAIIKPQLVWSVRKRFTAVRDVAIGSDGSIILCTESGHVFVRTRRTEAEIPNPGSTEGSNKSKGGSFKFQAIPFLQRITGVSMSDSGGLAAIRSGVSLKEIPIIGNSLSSDFEKLLPHLKMNGQKDEIVNEMEDLVDNGKEDNLGDDDDREVEEEEDTDTEKESFRDSQVRMARLLGEAASRWSKNEDSDNQIKEIPYGYDMFVVAGSRSIPAHRSILASRIPSISSILESPPSKGSGNAPEGVIARKVKCSLDGERTCISLSIPGCSFATALFLLHFLYTDQLPAVWTSSIGLAIEKEYSNQKVNKSQIHSQLKNLARLFNLNSLLPCLDSPVPRLPLSTLSSNMSNFFDLHVDVEDYRDSKLRDVELRLEDRIVPCHTAVLRRSPFFSALLQLDWTANRWKDGIIEIEMSHMKWKIGKIILKHLYTDSTFSTFDGVDSNLDKQDEFLDFVVETLAFSNEFLLDKLKSVCQVFLQRRILSNNISAILTDSDTYHCLKLKEVCMEICTRSLETLLESNMLDELGHKALKDLTNHVRKRQDDRMHRSQAKQRLDFLCEIHKDFLDDLDLPKPSLNLVSNKVPNRNSLPPKNNVKMIENSVPSTPLRRKVTWGSPELRPLTQNQVGNGIPTQYIPSLGDAGLMFNMDDEEAENSLENKSQSSKTTTPWKSKSAAERALESSQSKRVSSPSPSPSFSPSVPTPQTNPTPSVDLRSIMAAQQQRPSLPTSASNSGSVTPIKSSSNSIDSKISVPLNISSKLSQKDRKKQAQALAQQQQQQQAAAASLTSSNLPSSPTSRSSIAPWASTNSGSSTPQPSSPWRRPVSNHPETPPWMSLDGNSQSGNTNGTSPSTLPSSPTPPRSTNSSQSQSFLRKSLSNAASNAEHQSSSWSNSAEQSSLGPTYTPVRMQPQGRTSLGGRTASSEVAWTSARSSSVGGLSTNSDFGSSPSPKTFSGGLSSSRPSPSTNTSSFSRTPPLSSTISSNQIPHSSPLTSSSPSIQMTFAQIQEQQRLDLENANALQKAASSKSFAQIIEEEERESEELKKKLLKEEKEKVEFEKWWKEESKRVQKENNAASGGGGKKSKSGGSKGKKNKSSGEGPNSNPPKDAATGSGNAVNAEGESGETNKSSSRGGNRGRGRGRGSRGRGGGALANGNDNHNNRNQQSQQVKDPQPPQ